MTSKPGETRAVSPHGRGRGPRRRIAGLARADRCPVPGCQARIDPSRLMCRSHWYLVPKQIRDQVWATWRSGQGALSPEHQGAVRMAITACQARPAAGLLRSPARHLPAGDAGSMDGVRARAGLATSAERPPRSGPPSAAVGTITRMAYDQGLADRIRRLIGSDPEVTEKKMFGGLAFLIRGNMAIAASGEGGALVRVDPGQSDSLLAAAGATLAVMRGRAMPGWLRVAAEHLRTDDQLATWVRAGTGYARSLPPK